MLVRVRNEALGLEYDMGASHAAARGLEVIAEGVRPSPPTRLGGRPRKKRVRIPAAVKPIPETTVATEAETVTEEAS